MLLVRVTSPASCRAAAPTMAIAMASSHMRMRRQSPKVTRSVMAPIVQKLTRCATAPKTTATRKASPATNGARAAGSGIAKLSHAARHALLNPAGAFRPFARPVLPHRSLAIMNALFTVVRTMQWKWALTAAVLYALSVGPALAIGRIVDVQVIDRSDGRPLQVVYKDGQAWIVGTPGHEYLVRVRNRASGRLLAVTSVDGVNVVTGDTASPAQSGYVLGSYDALDITGWRKNLATTAAFYFTDLGDAYATRTGRPDNVGV